MLNKALSYRADNSALYWLAFKDTAVISRLLQTFVAGQTILMYFTDNFGVSKSLDLAETLLCNDDQS